MPKPAATSLQRYRARRDFTKTLEPAGAKRRPARRLEFVVQRHHARRLHYDFRLEWDGVLKSWAVPKGPSLDPAEKRLAVQVEDHPFEYRKFSGDIPAGEYGAGHVIIWDRGTWVPSGDVDRGLAAGKLDFMLHGERLQGAWSLVRLEQDTSGKSNWLLVKQRDLHAARAGAPGITGLHTDPVTAGKRARSLRKPGTAGARSRATATAPRATARNTARGAVRRAGDEAESSSRIEFIPPQLATPVATVPRGGRWLTELKFDGYRIVSYVDGARVHCYTRSGQDWTHKMPAVAATLAQLGLHDTLARRRTRGGRRARHAAIPAPAAGARPREWRGAVADGLRRAAARGRRPAREAPTGTQAAVATGACDAGARRPRQAGRFRGQREPGPD